MQTLLSLLRKSLTTVKVIFFLLALVFWGFAIYDASKLPHVVVLQMVWIFSSSIATYFLVGSDDDSEFLDRPDLWLWLLNFWVIVLVSGFAWGVLWGVGIFISMLALITIGSLPSFFFGTRYNKSAGVDFPVGFGN